MLTERSVLESAVVLADEDEIKPRQDVVFDIETKPLTDDPKAGLSAETAAITAIGYGLPDSNRIYIDHCDGQERLLIRKFWTVVESVRSAGCRMIGFNSANFDLPMLVRRSWKHSVPVPKNLLRYGKWDDSLFVDLMVVWACTEWKKFISLDRLSQYLGVGEKAGEGISFHTLWNSDRQAAIKYLATDIALPTLCAERMGVIHISA